MTKQYTYAKGVEGMTFYTKSTATLGFSAAASANVGKNGLSLAIADGAAEFHFAGLKASVGSPVLVAIDLSNGLSWEFEKSEFVGTGIYADKKVAKVDTGLAETESAIADLEKAATKLETKAAKMAIRAVNLKSSGVSVS